MKRSAVILGRDYRLRYARKGLLRVRAIAWVVRHDVVTGRSVTLLKVEQRHEATGHALPGHNHETLSPAELLVPWDDASNAADLDRRAARDAAIAVLRDAVASAKLTETTVTPGTGGRVRVELSVADGETLALLLTHRPRHDGPYLRDLIGRLDSITGVDADDAVAAARDEAASALALLLLDDETLTPEEDR